jgi:hypothetical protein
MESDRFPNQSERFLTSLCGRNATGKIRHVCPKRYWTFLDNDQIAQSRSPIFLSPACLSTLLSVHGGCEVKVGPPGRLC